MKYNDAMFATEESFHYTPETAPGSTEGKRRAAAYCRVSTLTEEQELSFDAQVSYYSEMISRDPSLILVGIYADQGFSGLNMSRRKEFQRMLSDCEAGLIDVIFVKSVSRFSRNAADGLAVLKRLNALGIQVLFEKKGLDSSNPATEMILNIYATMAQNESCSQSENIRWAHTHNAQMGNPIRNACFGYRIMKKEGDPFRYWVIHEEEAKIVRQVFSLAWQGYSMGEICARMKMRNAQVASILHNEAYKGDLLTNKTLRLDYASKKVIMNTGQRDQIYIEEHHEPIVDPAIFDEVLHYHKSGMLDARSYVIRQNWMAGHPELEERRRAAAAGTLSVGGKKKG